MKRTALQMQADISRQTASFQKDLEASRVQLQAASRIQPEMESMQKQLTEATKAIQAQQKVLSSSEEFAKSVFSSHVTEYFSLKLNAGAARTIDLKNRYAIIPPSTKETKNTIVCWTRCQFRERSNCSSRSPFSPPTLISTSITWLCSFGAIRPRV